MLTDTYGWRCESETCVPSSRGLVRQYNQELCISSNSRCFTKRLQSRPLNWRFNAVLQLLHFQLQLLWIQTMICSLNWKMSFGNTHYILGFCVSQWWNVKLLIPTFHDGKMWNIKTKSVVREWTCFTKKCLQSRWLQWCKDQGNSARRNLWQ